MYIILAVAVASSSKMNHLQCTCVTCICYHVISKMSMFIVLITPCECILKLQSVTIKQELHLGDGLYSAYCVHHCRMVKFSVSQVAKMPFGKV